MEITSLPLRGADKEWAMSASRGDLLDAMSEAGRLRRHVDLAMTVCRAELARRRANGCGHEAADEIAAGQAAGVGRRTGRRDERRAAVADAVDAAAEALSTGEISGEHLDAVSSIVPEELLDAVIDNQHDLFDTARGQSADRFRKELARFVRDVERQRGIDRATRQRSARKGRCHPVTRTGMIELHAELDPITGAHVSSRIRTEYKRLMRLDQQAAGSETPHHEADPDRTVEQRWADAITNTICARTNNDSENKAVDDRLPVVVIERALLEDRTDDGRCEIPGIDRINPDTARYMTCDRPLLGLSVDPNGKPVALTHFGRHANTAQRRALAATWSTCVGPDCDVAFADCHIHHTIPWTTKPVTNITELAPLCARHHHLAHEGGWTIKHLPDHTIEWTNPQRHTHTRPPHPPPDTS
jgi:hypothetical protein